ncbi:MAG TPA: HAD family phosphatase [Thermoanaerobaculia bacterium]|nr:HAD family phosphatase [Thermoanaerobaculia bacterium]
MTLPVRQLPRNLPPAIAAAIFDFDETMIDLEDQHAIADSELCRVMGSDYMEMPESFRFSSGRRIVDNIRDLRTFFGWREDEKTLFRIRQQLFEASCASSDLALMPGVAPVVRQLHAAGLRLAIASSAVRGAIETILLRFDLLDCFELIVDGGEVEHGKPHPEAFEVTARRLNVAPAECLVFEDSGVGVAATRAAGMLCIAVRNPAARQKQDLGGADLVIESFEELDVDGIARRVTSRPNGRSTPPKGG